MVIIFTLLKVNFFLLEKFVFVSTLQPLIGEIIIGLLDGVIFNLYFGVTFNVFFGVIFLGLIALNNIFLTPD